MLPFHSVNQYCHWEDIIIIIIYIDAIIINNVITNVDIIIRASQLHYRVLLVWILFCAVICG